MTTLHDHLGNQIAAELSQLNGRSWVSKVDTNGGGEPFPGRCEFTSNDGLRFFVSADNWHEYAPGGMLHLYPGRLTFADGSHYSTRNRAIPSINVSSKRTAVALAKDIYRRFIPDYEAWYQEAQRIIKKWDRSEAVKNRNRDMILGQFGGRVGWNGDTGHRNVRREEDGVTSCWEFRMRQAGGVMELKFSYLDVEEAMELIQLFETMKGAGQ